MPFKTAHKHGAKPNGSSAQETCRLEDDMPACQSCRKKKARCSRAQPCDQCTRFNIPCVYDDRRMKPGLRAGAVDQLYRRIETLENMFLGQEMIWQQMWQALHPDSTLPVFREQPGNITGLEQRREELKASLSQLASSSRQSNGKRILGEDVLEPESVSRPEKRPRADPVPTAIDSEPSGLLPPEIMNELVDFYYANIHHWLPILDVTKFRERMRSEEDRPRITCILHAIIAVCVRFSKNEQLQDEESKRQIAEKSRQKVILDSIESFSVENLQALTIVAFETVSTWPSTARHLH